MAKKKPRKTPSPPRDVERPEENLSTPTAGARTGLLVGVTAITALLVAIASFLPAVRLWGLNHLAFLPVPFRIALLAVIALSFLPPVAQALYQGASAALERAATTRGRSGALVALVVIALASTIVFYKFHSATNLLGDGQLITQSFEAAEEGHDQVIMRSARAIVTEEGIAPGATLLYYGAIKTLKPFKRTPVDSMRLFNCLLGGLFVFFTLLASSNRALPSDARVWLIVLALFSSSIMLFFGYIENYTAPMFFLLLYVIAAFRALHRMGSPWLAALPLLCAIYCHIQCVLFVPSFVYLMLWTKVRGRRELLLRRWMPVFSAATLIFVVGVTLYEPIRRFYAPLGFSNAEYALFSPDHLLDVVNELLILLPILPTVAAMAWVGRRADRADGRDPVRDGRALKDPTAWFSHPAEWQLVGTILVPCMLYLVLFHPEIGMARDWDLFSMMTTAIVPLVLLVLGRYTRTTGAAAAATARFATPALVIVMALGVSWVAVNASTDRTVERFETILTYDQTHASYAWENLAILQQESGQIKQAIRSMERAVEVSHNPRQIVRLAVYIEEDGRIDEAIAMLEEVLVKRPEFSKARFRLVMFLEKKGQWDKMLPVARDGVKYSPEDAIYHFMYGECLLRAGQTEDAMQIFRVCQTMDLPQTVKQYIAATLAQHEGK